MWSYSAIPFGRHTHTGWGGVVGWQWRLLKHVIVITSISLICQIPSTREAEEWSGECFHEKLCSISPCTGLPSHPSPTAGGRFAPKLNWTCVDNNWRWLITGGRLPERAQFDERPQIKQRKLAHWKTCNYFSTAAGDQQNRRGAEVTKYGEQAIIYNIGGHSCRMRRTETILTKAFIIEFLPHLGPHKRNDTILQRKECEQ